MISPSAIARICIPGLAFQAVMIGGGYATGRELISFFFTSGPLGGLLAMAVTAAILSATVAICLAFSHRFKLFEYRAFFQRLIGPGWILIEVAFVLQIVVVLAVLGAGSGEIVNQLFGLPRLFGISALILGCVVIVYLGAEAIARLLSWWSLVLYLAYFLLFVIFAAAFGGEMRSSIVQGPPPANLIVNGATYAGMNINCFMSVLFIVPILRSQKEAIAAGLLTGPIAMLPAIAFFAVMMTFYPEIGAEPVPLTFLLERLQEPYLALFLHIAIFGTFLQTGVGTLNALNERIHAQLAAHERRFTTLGQAGVAGAILLFSIVLADQLGLVALIDKGYGFLAWVFIVLIFVPVFTAGLWKLFAAARRPADV